MMKMNNKQLRNITILLSYVSRLPISLIMPYDNPISPIRTLTLFWILYPE